MQNNKDENNANPFKHKGYNAHSANSYCCYSIKIRKNTFKTQFFWLIFSHILTIRYIKKTPLDQNWFSGVFSYVLPFKALYHISYKCLIVNCNTYILIFTFSNTASTSCRLCLKRVFGGYCNTPYPALSDLYWF